MSVNSYTESSHDARMNPSTNPTVLLTIQPPVLLDRTVREPPQIFLTTHTQANFATMLTNSAAANEKPRAIAYNQGLVIDGILDFVVKKYKSYYNQGCK